MGKTVFTKTNAVFLILTLVVGTITMISHFYIIKTAVAQSELNYEKDHYFKSKVSSIEKTTQNNNIDKNVNVNGLKNHDINTVSMPFDANGLVDLAIPQQDFSNDNTGRTSLFGDNVAKEDKNDNIKGKYSIFADIDNNNNERKIYAQQKLQQLPQVSFVTPFSLASGPDLQTHPHVDAYGNNVHVSFTNQTGGHSYIYYTKSTDGGTSFSSPIPLTDDTAHSHLNAIAVSGDNVYVAWTSVTNQSDIYLVKSNDGGTSFSSPIKLNKGEERLPVIAASGNNVYVAWQSFDLGELSNDDLNSKIEFTASTDGGITFSTPQDISNVSSNILSGFPSLAASDSNVYLVWQDCALTGQDCNTMFAKSIDNGTTFSSPEILVNAIYGVENTFLPDIGVMENALFVVFGKINYIDNQRDVYLITSLDGGATFGTPILIDNTPEYEYNPSIDVSGNNIGITWEKRDQNSLTGKWEVFFTGSIDGGSTFSNPISLNGSSPSHPDSTLSEIAMYDSNVYSVWSNSKSSEDRDIFFTSGLILPSTPDDNTPPIITINSAADDYNNPITNQTGTTVSNTIMFDFAVVDDVDIGSVACYLDDNPIACESSPVIYTVQSTGQHIFRIDATDTSNNPSSIRFVWTVLTLQEGIEQIILTIDSMDLPKGIANSLKGPLHQATKLLSDDNPNNDNTACNKLTTFIEEQVNYYLSNGQLTQEQADILTQQAQSIKLELGCQ